MLAGRLGLESAAVPHKDRHGLMWLGRGKLYVEDGTLHFTAAKQPDLEAGDYAIPFQMLSCLVLQPGTSVSHDALRLLARHGVDLVAAGRDGVRFYASLPAGPDRSARARRHAELWADAKGKRAHVVRRMYAWRMGTVVPAIHIDALRGMEGARVKKAYKQLAAEFGIPWHGRRYDRSRPLAADVPNQAINHAATATQGAAMVAVAASGAIPQLGFIHEDSGRAFALDIADLFREKVTLPVAFGAARAVLRGQSQDLEREVRSLAGKEFRNRQLVTKMIGRIKELLDEA